MTKPNILVADDDPHFRKLTARLLEQEGYEVQVVDDAPSALERLGREVFDLLVADVNMPGNEGLAILRDQDVVPVLVVTGDPSMETAISALRGSAVDYLTKPIAPPRFLERVADGVERGRALRTLRTAEEGLRDQLELVTGLLRTLGAAGAPPLDPKRPLPRSLTEALSEREVEIVQVFRTNPRAADIAAKLHISLHTARNHLRNIYRKLGVNSQTELMQRIDQSYPSRGT